MTFSDFALTREWDRTELSSYSTLVSRSVCRIPQPHAIMALNGTIALLCLAWMGSLARIMPEKIQHQKLVLGEMYGDPSFCSVRFRLGCHSDRWCAVRGAGVSKISDSSMS